MFIGLKPRSERKLSAQQVIMELAHKLANIPGINTYLQVVQDLHIGGQNNAGQYSFSILDPSLAGLDTITSAIEQRLRQLQTINNVSSNQNKAETQITAKIDRSSAARLGVTVAAVDAALENAFAQRQISRIYKSQNQYAVVMKAQFIP